MPELTLQEVIADAKAGKAKLEEMVGIVSPEHQATLENFFAKFEALINHEALAVAAAATEIADASKADS